MEIILPFLFGLVVGFYVGIGIGKNMGIEWANKELDRVMGKMAIDDYSTKKIRKVK